MCAYTNVCIYMYIYVMCIYYIYNIYNIFIYYIYIYLCYQCIPEGVLGIFLGGFHVQIYQTLTFY